MAIRECSTQAEADAAAAEGKIIRWRAGVLMLHGSSRAVLHGGSRAYLHDSSSAYLYDSSRADLYGSSRADLHGSSHAVLHGSSRAYLHDRSSAYLYDSSRADLYGSSRADLYDSSSADLHGSSRAVLHGSSRAYLHGSSSAVDGSTGVPLRRDRPRIVIGPLGSRDNTLGVSLPSDGSEPVVYAECWSGRLSDFAARVDKCYPTGRYGDEYRAAIAYIHAIVAIPQGDA